MMKFFSTLRFRLLVFAVTILSLGGLILAASWSTWQTLRAINLVLDDGQLKSFGIAEHFRAELQGLDNALLEYAITKSPQKLEEFRETSSQMNRWIDQQKGNLTTSPESEVLERIDEAFDLYLQEARRVSEQPFELSRGSDRAALGKIEARSTQLLNLGYELALAHNSSLTELFSASRSSIASLQVYSITGMLLLMGAVSWLGLIVYRDMIAPLRTRLVQSEAIISRQEKLASLGMLAAGVAHEIRNPLTAIKGRLFRQQRRAAPGSAAEEDFRVIAGEITRLEQLVRNVLDFARPEEPALRPVDAAALLLEVHDLMEPTLARKEVWLHVQAEPGLILRADSRQIKQVLLNLIQNAADSITDGPAREYPREARGGAEEKGLVTLRAIPTHHTLRGTRTPCVLLEVEDNGSGMPPEVEKRLFDPFYTTKDQGTGLGLSIAARIVEKHGGALQYRTRPGIGTTFGVALPLHSGPAEPEAGARTEAVSRGEAEK
ncbi:hypothetical protein DB346_16430 [Verrucomicrobia bacterium LW23]|nr:hypothetical protein DB346_16430 [Verrucomicrobia bacterium LW23]